MAMTKLVFKDGTARVPEIILRPGANRLGRAADNDFPIEHPSISSAHCEIVLTDEAVHVRDLGSTNGTFIERVPVREGRLCEGQTLTLGEVEMILRDAPVRVAIPVRPTAAPEAPAFLPDGSPCCVKHRTVAATLECVVCHEVHCAACVRELHIAGGKSMWFCPSCGNHCEPLKPRTAQAPKKKSFFDKILAVFTEPPKRR